MHQIRYHLFDAAASPKQAGPHARPATPEASGTLTRKVLELLFSAQHHRCAHGMCKGTARKLLS